MVPQGYKYDYVIGIDAGTNTGFAIKDKHTGKFIEVKTIAIHTAMFQVADTFKKGDKILVLIEDARQATFNRSSEKDKFRAQGAGSVKRDASIWEDFLKDYKIPFLMLRPQKAKTKWAPHVFKAVTGYTRRTSHNARDAAVLTLTY